MDSVEFVPPQWCRSNLDTTRILWMPNIETFFQWKGCFWAQLCFPEWVPSLHSRTPTKVDKGKSAAPSQEKRFFVSPPSFAAGGRYRNSSELCPVTLSSFQRIHKRRRNLGNFNFFSPKLVRGWARDWTVLRKGWALLGWKRWNSSFFRRHCRSRIKTVDQLRAFQIEAVRQNFNFFVLSGETWSTWRNYFGPIGRKLRQDEDFVVVVGVGRRHPLRVHPRSVRCATHWSWLIITRN